MPPNPPPPTVRPLFGRFAGNPYKPSECNNRLTGGLDNGRMFSFESARSHKSGASSVASSTYARSIRSRSASVDDKENSILRREFVAGEAHNLSVDGIPVECFSLDNSDSQQKSRQQTALHADVLQKHNRLFASKENHDREARISSFADKEIKLRMILDEKKRQEAGTPPPPPLPPSILNEGQPKVHEERGTSPTPPPHMLVTEPSPLTGSSFKVMEEKRKLAGTPPLAPPPPSVRSVTPPPVAAPVLPTFTNVVAAPTNPVTVPEVTHVPVCRCGGVIMGATTTHTHVTNTSCCSKTGGAEGQPLTSPAPAPAAVAAAATTATTATTGLQQKLTMCDEMMELVQLESFVSKKWENISARERDINLQHEALAKAERELRERRAAVAAIEADLRSREQAVQSKETKIVLAEQTVKQMQTKFEQRQTLEGDLIGREKDCQRRKQALVQLEAELRERTSKLERNEKELAELEQWTSKRGLEIRSRKELFEKAQRSQELESRVEELQCRIQATSLMQRRMPEPNPATIPRKPVMTVDVAQTEPLPAPADTQTEQEIAGLRLALVEDRKKLDEAQDLLRNAEQCIESDKLKSQAEAQSQNLKAAEMLRQLSERQAEIWKQEQALHEKELKMIQQSTDLETKYRELLKEKDAAQSTVTTQAYNDRIAEEKHLSEISAAIAAQQKETDANRQLMLEQKERFEFLQNQLEEEKRSKEELWQELTRLQAVTKHKADLIEVVTEQKNELERREQKFEEERRRQQTELEALQKLTRELQTQGQTHKSQVEEQQQEIERLERLLVETQRDNFKVEQVQASLREKEQALAEQQKRIGELQRALEAVNVAEQRTSLGTPATQSQTYGNGPNAGLLMDWVIEEERVRRADIIEQAACMFEEVFEHEVESRRYHRMLQRQREQREQKPKLEVPSRPPPPIPTLKTSTSSVVSIDEDTPRTQSVAVAGPSASSSSTQEQPKEESETKVLLATHFEPVGVPPLSARSSRAATPRKGDYVTPFSPYRNTLKQHQKRSASSSKIRSVSCSAVPRPPSSIASGSNTPRGLGPSGMNTPRVNSALGLPFSATNSRSCTPTIATVSDSESEMNRSFDLDQFRSLEMRTTDPKLKKKVEMERFKLYKAAWEETLKREQERREGKQPVSEVEVYSF